LGGGREQAVLSAEEPSGRPVVDLTKDSITVARRVEEKTLPVQIESLTPQPNMSALAAVCFAVDTSSSMGYDKRLQSAGLALKELLAEIPEEVRVGLVRFGTGAELLCSVSGKRDSVVTALDALLPQGHTAFWDAVALCLEDLSGIQGRRGVVVLADGPDDIAPDRMGPVEQRAVDLGIPVYVVTLDMKQDAYAMLAELAAVSGSGAEGVGVVRLRSPNGIVDAYRGMLERLATVYRLTWRSPAPRGEGKGGKLVVSVDTTRGEKRAVGTVLME
jgi:Mg-chelatase subunit ChlD